MKYYELSYLLPSELTGQELDDFLAKIVSFIQEKKGILAENIRDKEALGKRKLSFSIKKGGQGYLATLNFYLEPQEIEGLKTKLNSESQIIRYIILTKEVPKKRKAFRIFSKTPRAEKESKPPSEKADLKEIEKKLEEILEE